MLNPDCPELFVPICKLLQKAFPDSAASVELLAIIRVLVPEFSSRNLAIVIQHAFNIPYYSALHEVGRAECDTELITEEIAAEVLRRLKSDGYDEWLEQYGERLGD